MLAQQGQISELSLDLSTVSAPKSSVHEIRVHPGTFRTVSLVALQNVLFLLRIAS
jgi:hypothetical protein